MKSIFRLNNIPAFLICAIHMTALFFIINTVAEDEWTSVAAVAGTYIMMFLVTISPVGEGIYRILSGGRRIKTREWEYKISLAHKVVDDARENDRHIPKKINFYYVSDAVPQAFSIGRHTVCLTSGLLEQSPDIINGCVAHELGHISRYDSSVLQIANAGNMIVMLCAAIFQGIHLCNKKASLFTKRGAGNLLRSVFTFIPMGIAFLALGLTNIILNIGNRGKEYAADAYAVRIGYGNELRRALNSIDLEGKTSRRGFWRVLTAAHPGVYDRIGRIDMQMDSSDFGTGSLYELVNS